MDGTYMHTGSVLKETHCPLPQQCGSLLMDIYCPLPLAGCVLKDAHCPLPPALQRCTEGDPMRTAPCVF